MIIISITLFTLSLTLIAKSKVAELNVSKDTDLLNFCRVDRVEFSKKIIKSGREKPAGWIRWKKTGYSSSLFGFMLHPSSSHLILRQK